MKTKPGFTKVDDYFMDKVMPRVSGAEWKIICSVLRETVGEFREEETITVDRFMTMTGLERQAVIEAVRQVCLSTVIERRTQQIGRQRTFRFRAIPHANLKVVSKRERRRHQAGLPFDIPTSTEFENQTPMSGNDTEENAAHFETEFENQTPSRSLKIKLPTAVTEFENQTPNAPVLMSDLDQEDLDLTHRSRARKLEPVENIAARQRVRGSKFTKKQIREYAWANHNFYQTVNAYWEARGKKQNFIDGVHNPVGWTTVALRSGEHDEEIQEWIEDPDIFSFERFRKSNSGTY